MRVDLHMHTACSDGDLTPAELVQQAAASELDLISVTDHDTTDGVRPAQAAAADVGVRVLPGVELSSTHQGREIHILGYGVDPGHENMRAHCTSARRLRLGRMEAMVERLGEQGLEVEMAEVLAEAGSGAAMVGRPHLARALVGRGYVDSIPEAFDTLIGDGHRAFVPTLLATPAEAVTTIREAGGVPVWAHPPMEALDGLLPELLDAGLRGLEAYRPGWPARRQRQLLGRAQSLGLVVTGGSDFHGPGRNGGMGVFWVRGSLLRAFLEEVGLVQE